MSQQNVELVRRLYATLAELPGLRDIGPEDGRAWMDRIFGEYLDDHWELRLPAEYPEGDLLLQGREGGARLIAQLRDAWAEWRFEPERLMDAGDQVVVFVRVLAKGGASGVPIELTGAHVQTSRDGRVTRTQIYRDRADALHAVGLYPDP